jgi:hypothetical protein
VSLPSTDTELQQCKIIFFLTPPRPAYIFLKYQTCQQERDLESKYPKLPKPKFEDFMKTNCSFLINQGVSLPALHTLFSKCILWPVKMLSSATFSW